MAPVAQRYVLATKITTKNVREHAGTASRLAILLYLALCERTGKGGRTQGQMLEDTEMSPRTIGTAVRELVAAGVLTTAG